MDNTVRLNEAFKTFTQASKSLETYYSKLGERVQHLTEELEKKNAQLSDVIYRLRESTDFLHAVLQSIGEAMIVLDQDDRITMINRAAEVLMHVNTKDVIGRAFRDLPAKFMEEGSGTVLFVERQRYDVIRSRSKVLDADGQVRGYVVLIKDITRLKEFERQNERNARLIAMGEMAAKIVHEIRSPLCSIELFSTMLSKDLECTSHADMAKGISTGIQSLNNILTNMLLFARNQKPVFRETALASVIDDTLGMITPLTDIRRIAVTRSVGPFAISGDHELLKQVFLNILMNAVQSMQEGGEMKISMGEHEEHVMVSVEDEGDGISPENIERIFDPFFSTKDKGTGLGLTIAYKIMQCHEGFIKVFANEKKGSTFCLYFPKYEKKDIPKEEVAVCMKK